MNSENKTVQKLTCLKVNNGFSILLPITVGKLQAKLVLDTGAAVTILSSNVYNKIPPGQRPELMKVSPSLKLEVANDELLSVLGLH